MMRDYDTLARRVIRCLLDDSGSVPSFTEEELGPWHESVTALREAHAEGGAGAVHQVFIALARRQPGLIHLVAGGDAAHKTVWTAAELFATDFPPPVFVVDELLPRGLSILAGRPKLGKSWLALQIAGAVGGGGTVLGQDVDRGRVLYLALEDNARRLRERAERQGMNVEATVTFHTAWEPLNRQGLVDLMLALEEGYRFVVIDTLSRALGRADQMDAADMTVLLGSLQQLASRHDLGLLLVDHHRKATHFASDPIDDIFGSTAKAGVIDAAWGLYKKRGASTATLKITGRDLADRELALAWQAERCRWDFAGEAQEVELTARRQELVDALGHLGRVQLRELAETVGQERGNTYRRLKALVQTGQVVREQDGQAVFYALPDDLQQ